MGLEFISKTRPGFERRESSELEEILSRSLFESTPRTRRIFRANLLLVSTPIEVGSFCYVHIEDDSLAIYDTEMRRIAEASRPPAGVLEAVRERGYGRAVGTVAAVLDLAEQLDIALDNES